MKLCVSVVEPTIARAREAADRAARAGAFAEIRLDAVDGCERLAVEDLEPLAGSGELLLTFRRPADGGHRAVDDRRRLELLVGGARRLGAMCDVEFDCAGAAAALGAPPDRLVVSQHDFERTPDDLVGLFDRMAEVPAAIYKIATRARRTRDVFAHFDVLARARARSLGAVAIAMGEQGVATRVLGPAWGAPFTFCSEGRGREAAPGQVALDEMRRLYRADRATPETAVAGLVGGSVGYSLSPAMHNGAAAALGLDFVYVPFAVDDLEGFLDATVLGPRRVEWNVRGFSVTNPFKVAVAALCDRLDPLAARAGAVNTLVVGEDGRLSGYNTDVAGAIGPLEALAGSLAGLRVGVVGAGGAARALLCGLGARGAHAAVFARDLGRAREAAEPFGAEAHGLDEIASSRLDVLVNATPVGTEGGREGRSPVPERALEGVRIVYDLVYAPERTRLLEMAEHAGCATLGGLPMLATQAALQFELFTGRTVSAERMMVLARATEARP